MLLLGIAWGGAPAGKIPVVASIVPLADFCRQLGGERVEVQVLIPPGASPHVFEPPPSVVARAGKARLFVYIGGGMEPWAAKLLKSRGTENLEVVEAVQGIPLIKEAGESHHQEAAEEKHHHHKPDAGAEKAHDDHEGHNHEAGNPHVWLDPVLAQDICRRITAALILLDPGHSQDYEARRDRYLQELADLHQEMEKRVSSFRLREFVCFHPAFSYLARRYGLKEVGVIELSPGREPTPRHLQKIVRAIKKYGIKVVFAEPQLNPRVAEVIAREAGAKVLFIDPVGGRPPYGEDYLKLMRYNLSIMEEAMK
ncbi:MAG: zinc ABC transporter substrate-binding protein [Deltaproteobacteria bacterium]|nr:zinc ABC transporter substrate-binding protein [Deltaproteobacteria bacterium]MBI4796056.1 zinc ABC transporter substrate-binding protein [Deltaproteobacteria bacterium]